MKVLAATDGSRYGRWAIEWLARVPFNRPPVVRVLHVVDVGGLRAPFMIQPLVVGTARYLQSEVKRMETMARTTKRQASVLLASLGLNGKVVVDRGRVATTIVQHAKRSVGLLSIGWRGLDALDRFMLGGTSNNVLHQAPCPVLVVKAAPRPLRRIVLAVDGSPASDRAARFLLRHIEPNPAGLGRRPITVTVVHAVPTSKYPELRDAGATGIQRYATQLGRSGFQVKEAVRMGKPADQILTVAKQHKAELIVTGATGVGAISRVLLGSVSTRVVQHATCSVLVIR